MSEPKDYCSMKRASTYGDRTLRNKNIGIVLLCAMSSFWFLASPLVPYTFATTTLAGLALFAGIHLLLTGTLGTIGVTLNYMTAHQVPVTRHGVRRALVATLRRR
jgi:hypothetical protein